MFFFKKNGRQRYAYLVVGSTNYFVQSHSDSTNKYTEEDIVGMLEFLIDNIFVTFGGQIFQQTTGIPMGTNCAPLLADLYLYSYEAEFMEGLVRDGNKNMAKSFNFTFRYIDDVLSINNSSFGDYLPLIYPAELEIKDTTESVTSTAYLDLSIEHHNNKLYTKLYDKRDDFNFPIVNFPYLDSNIPTSPAYGVYISQLIRYARACCDYTDFHLRGKLLTSKLLSQGYSKLRLIATLKKFYGRRHDLIGRYGVSVARMVMDFDLSNLISTDSDGSVIK